VGHIKLWVEVFRKRSNKTKKKASRQYKLWDIRSAPVKKFELRVVVWDTRDVPNNDPEDMSDIYVKANLSSLDHSLTEKTDTHIRASDGFVSPHLTSGLIQLENDLPDPNRRVLHGRGGHEPLQNRVPNLG
jgi:hypothetical protein